MDSHSGIKNELTLMVGKFLRNSGRCLNIKRQVGVLLWEHRGWMLHMAFSYKAKTWHTSARFPISNTEESTIPRRSLDSRQRIVLNACQSLMAYIWQSGVATRSCCHGIQVFCLRNSLNFHKNGIQVRIKA